jgi:ferredoxin
MFELQGQVIECFQGANLRSVLVNNGVDLYNGNAKVINCRGISICGTCAVLMESEVLQANRRKQTRLSLPPTFLKATYT